MQDQPPRKRIRHFNEPGQAHELTFSCFQRLPLLGRDRTRQWMIEALAATRDKFHLQLWAYVIMPEHVHVLLLPMERSYDMAAILKALKLPVSRRAMNWLRRRQSPFLGRLRVQHADGSIEHRFW